MNLAVFHPNKLELFFFGQQLSLMQNPLVFLSKVFIHINLFLPKFRLPICLSPSVTRFTVQQSNNNRLGLFLVRSTSSVSGLNIIERIINTNFCPQCCNYIIDFLVFGYRDSIYNDIDMSLTLL
uniref:Uncharacterized protein n=1 Tax=Cacopsylla melanoneura TaxID=428564 RepID=A0A8D9FHG8_9HEMI